MNIDRFKEHHANIIHGIDTLRKLAHQGIADHADDIASELKKLAQLVTQHLAIEDRILYPTLEHCGHDHIARMSLAYQNDMKGIANAFISFSRRWSNSAQLSSAPEAFRSEANSVLKDVHGRIARENREFYPAIETLTL